MAEVLDRLFGPTTIGALSFDNILFPTPSPFVPKPCSSVSSAPSEPFSPDEFPFSSATSPSLGSALASPTLLSSIPTSFFDETDPPLLSPQSFLARCPDDFGRASASAVVADWLTDDFGVNEPAKGWEWGENLFPGLGDLPSRCG